MAKTRAWEQRYAEMEAMMAELRRSTLDFQKSTLEASRRFGGGQCREGGRQTYGSTTELLDLRFRDYLMLRHDDDDGTWTWTDHYSVMDDETDLLEEESMPQFQVPVSDLEHGLRIHNASSIDCEDSQYVVGCDELCEVEEVVNNTREPMPRISVNAVTGISDYDTMRAEEPPKSVADVVHVQPIELVVRDQAQEAISDVVSSPGASVTRVGAIQSQPCIFGRANHVWKPGELEQMMVIDDVVSLEKHGVQVQENRLQHEKESRLEVVTDKKELMEVDTSEVEHKTESFPFLNFAAGQHLLWMQNKSEPTFIISEPERKKKLCYKTWMFKYKVDEGDQGILQSRTENSLSKREISTSIYQAEALLCESKEPAISATQEPATFQSANAHGVITRGKDLRYSLLAVQRSWEKETHDVEITDGYYVLQEEFEQIENHTPCSVIKLERPQDHDALLLPLPSDERFQIKHSELLMIVLEWVDAKGGFGMDKKSLHLSF